ncbi:MAG: HAD family hydrolase [Myxococcales bacterium]|jgi:phosphoglycolate phosphatase-like HAD superfamily hydrolase
MVLRKSRAQLAALVGLCLLMSGCASSPTPEAKEPVTGAQAEPFLDPLPSWNDGVTKAKIIDFVRAVTDPDDPAFVEPERRIATFDNDGTLWVEQPVYTEMAFALHRVKDLAQVHPEWKTEEPFRAVLEGDKQALIASGKRGLVEIIVASHTGMSTTLFDTIVREWIRDARHPDFDKPYTELVYQPQLELLRYLESKGFTTFIVSGGSAEFMRVFSKETYGIPSQRVIGSSIQTRYEVQGGKPTLLRLQEIDFVNDGAGKPVGIYKGVGRQPILAFGNSDGDFEMLQWTTLGSREARLGLLLHHDDAEREYAYDRQSRVGTLDRALDAAGPQGWVVVSMKKDWKTVFQED